MEIARLGFERSVNPISTGGGGHIVPHPILILVHPALGNFLRPCHSLASADFTYESLSTKILAAIFMVLVNFKVTLIEKFLWPILNLPIL